MEWKLFFLVFRSVLLLGFSIYVFRVYLKTRLKSLIFIIVAFLSFFISEVGMIALFLLDTTSSELSIESIVSLFAANTVMLGIMLSGFAFLLLLKSTEVNAIRTNNIIISGIILAIIATALFILTVIASVTVLDHLEGRTDLNNIHLLSITSIWTLWFYLVFISIGFSLAILFWNWRLLNNKRKVTTSEQQQHVLTMLLHTFRLLIIGSVMSTIATFVQIPIVNDIGVLLTEIAFGAFTYIYIEKGIPSLGNNNIRALMIVNSDGNLLYDYNFNGFGNQQINSLFSSAIRAVSIIIDEYTETSEKLEAIQLEDSNLLIQTIDDQLTILLLVKSATHYDRTRLVSFSSSIKDDIKSLHKDRVELDDENYLDTKIKQIFG